jgi:hypothetical protein
LAIVSHGLMNAHLTNDADAAAALALLEESGYGLMSLPPTTQSESLRAAALDQLIDQLQDYVRHGYLAIVVESEPADHLVESLDAICRSRGIALLQRIPVGMNFRDSLGAVRAVRIGKG